MGSSVGVCVAGGRGVCVGSDVPVGTGVEVGTGTDGAQDMEVNTRKTIKQIIRFMFTPGWTDIISFQAL